MKDIDFGRGNVCVVEDAHQARLLSDDRSFRFLEPFIARELSASAAAAEIGCKLDTLLYRIRTFMAAGLLKLVRQEPRRGRPVKVYRASADAYFTPYAALPHADVQEGLLADATARNTQLVPALAQLLRSSELEGRMIFRSQSDGKVWRNSSSHPDAPEPARLKVVFEHILAGKNADVLVETYDGVIGTDFFTDLKLTRAEAKDLWQRLFKLWLAFSRLADNDTQQRQAYYLAVSFVEQERRESA